MLAMCGVIAALLVIVALLLQAFASGAAVKQEDSPPNQALHLTGDEPRGSAVPRVGRASSCVSPAAELGCSAAWNYGRQR